MDKEYKEIMQFLMDHIPIILDIERLNKRIEDLNTINEEHQMLNGMIRKELQQKENIIKEVREEIEKLANLYDDNYTITDKAKDILEILDKGE